MYKRQIPLLAGVDTILSGIENVKDPFSILPNATTPGFNVTNLAARDETSTVKLIFATAALLDLGT